MATLMQITCILFLVGTAHCWFSPSDIFNDFPSKNSSFLSIFEEMNKMMALMHQRFQYLTNSSSFSLNTSDDRKQFDAIEPICNTTINSPSSSIQQYRRKKFRQTKTITTTCTKELILNGKKQIYKATNITDENGKLISQNQIYQTISINTNNNTLPLDLNNDKDIITY